MTRSGGLVQGGGAMNDERRAHEAKLEAEWREWDAQIALLRARAERADAEEKIGHVQAVEALSHKHDAAGKKLRELRTASDEEWDDLKAGADGTWNDMTTALERAISRL